MLWLCFSKRHQDIRSPCYHLNLKHFDTKLWHKMEEKGGKVSNSLHTICWFSVVSNHWRMIWLGLGWGDFAFFYTSLCSHQSLMGTLVPLPDCLGALCSLWDDDHHQGAVLQSTSFIKKTRTLVSYSSMFKIISFLLWHLLPLQSSQNVWQSYQDLIVRGESWWGNWGMGLAGYALLHTLVSELGRLSSPHPCG